MVNKIFFIKSNDKQLYDSAVRLAQLPIPDLVKQPKTVVIGNNETMLTFCPKCHCEVPVRNPIAGEYAANGILCDECRSKNLSNQ